jgi:hypothetical protein
VQNRNDNADEHRHKHDGFTARAAPNNDQRAERDFGQSV